MRRSTVLAAAVALDLTAGELPNGLHPVALFGKAAGWADRRLAPWAEQQPLGAGVVLAAGGVLPAWLIGWAAHRTARRLPAPLALAAEAMVLKQAFSVRGLFEHVVAVRRPVARGNIAAARAAASLIVSRDTAQLDGGQLSSAAIESLSENASDSVVAPWLAYTVGGLGAALAYRAVNTLDAMVGYRERGRFGTPAARVDDAVNFLPARITALGLAIVSPGCSPGVRDLFADGSKTQSANSGWPMAAAAHALGVRLEKPSVHVLDEHGRTPAAPDIRRAERLVAMALGLVFVALFAALRRTGR
jgi:adenosylcobinamide-phosphate synthase